ncbi:MAG: hypothetical protein Q7T44_17215 [Parvibaculum sp.]|nr:hypothetical protein [Parvibaculum sp.]
MSLTRMPFARWFALASVAVLLSGCFVSVMPLFGPDDADYPLADGTKLRLYTLDEEGKRTHDKPSEASVKRLDVGYLFTPQDDKPFRAMFDDMRQGDFVGVAMPDGITGNPMYGLFRQKGKSWFAYAPVCSDFNDVAKAHGKKLSDFHIEKTDSDCRFKTYSDLKYALLFLAEYTPPSSEYVVE